VKVKRGNASPYGAGGLALNIEVLEDSLPISSSRIRAAIAAGDIRLAEAMLGRPLNG